MSSRNEVLDQLARSIGQRLPRRTIVRGVAAVLFGGAAVAAAEPAQALPRLRCRAYGTGCTRGTQCCSGSCDTRRQAPRNVRNRCACPVGTARCDGACLDLSINEDNCGACGNQCLSGEFCVSGTCVCGLTTCYDACVDLDTSVDHCGGCGDACKPTEICVSGNCGCPAGTEECNGVACVDYATDFDNCGYCEDPCDERTADTCVGGSCKCGSGARCISYKGQCISGSCMCGSAPACGDAVCFDDECHSCTVAAGADLCYIDVEKNEYQFSGGGSGGVGCGSSTSNDACEAGCDASRVCFCSRAYRATSASAMEPSSNCVSFPAENQVL